MLSVTIAVPLPTLPCTSVTVSVTVMGLLAESAQLKAVRLKPVLAMPQASGLPLFT